VVLGVGGLFSRPMGNTHMPPRSPQADNWLRTTNAVAVGYHVAFVPSALKDGYINYFEHVINKKNYRVAESRKRVHTLRQLMHPKRFAALEKAQNLFISKYPHTRGIFDGLQYIIYNRTDSRPFPRNLDESEVLEHLKQTMATAPSNYGNDYASLIQYDIGNGVVTSLPILVLYVSVETPPIPMPPL
jgi:hypothetical protein